MGYASWRGTAGIWDRPQVYPTLHIGFKCDCTDIWEMAHCSMSFTSFIFLSFSPTVSGQWETWGKLPTLLFSTKLSSIWLECVVPYSYSLIFFPVEKVVAFHSWSHKRGVCILDCTMSTPSAAHSATSLFWPCGWLLFYLIGLAFQLSLV